MSKTSDKKRWIKNHNSDFYVQQANKLGYISRASFKIIEIQKKYHIFKKNMFIIDLGSAPGGWSKQIIKYISNNGKLISIDLLDMNPIDNVEFIKGDFSNNETYQKINKIINKEKVDCIVSDMVPNISGNKTSDQAKSIYLLELVLDFVITNLKKNGSFIAKIFQGKGSNEYIELVQEYFDKIIKFKPKSSRPKSREFYIIASGFNKKISKLKI